MRVIKCRLPNQTHGHECGGVNSITLPNEASRQRTTKEAFSATFVMHAHDDGRNIEIAPTKDAPVLSNLKSHEGKVLYEAPKRRRACIGGQ